MGRRRDFERRKSRVNINGARAVKHKRDARKWEKSDRVKNEEKIERAGCKTRFCPSVGA